MTIKKLTKLFRILKAPILFRALLKGSAAGVEHKPVLNNLTCSTLIDIGANRGQFALIARKVFPQAVIHSFEPLVEPAEIFRRIFRDDTRVIFHPYAIGQKETTAVMHVAQNDDSSSLLPITQKQTQLYPGTLERETREVKVFPLSQLIDPETIPLNSFLKIDVQGFELDVLKGCEDILWKFANIYVECSFIEADDEDFDQNNLSTCFLCP